VRVAMLRELGLETIPALDHLYCDKLDIGV
jgi:hypothetical protein